MKLIYMYIEEYRNIKNQEFYFDTSYQVDISIKLNGNKRKYQIKNVKNDNSRTSIMEPMGNIENINLIVGKNGSGKTSILQVLGELHESFEEAKFLILYADNEGNFYIECNLICIEGLDGETYEVSHEESPPEVTIFRCNFEKREFEMLSNKQERIEGIEYLLVRHKVHDLTEPNNNNLNSRIGRYGIQYERKSIYYKLKYLNSEPKDDSGLHKEFLTIQIELDSKYHYFNEEDLKIQLVPKYYPGTENFFDCNPKGSKLFKQGFLLRLIEIVFSSIMNRAKKECGEFQEKVNKLVNECNKDIVKIYEKYAILIEIICEMHETFKMENRVNETDTQISFNKFLHQVKAVIELIPIKYFENTRRIEMNWEELDNNKKLYEQLEKLLKFMDNEDIDLDYCSSNIIDVDVFGLSDGYAMLSNLYAAIHKCIKLNNPSKMEKLILLLDEPDAFMHPEWSRRFINDLVEFIKNTFSEFVFQIVIATHSPYLVSDTPKEHIICLEDGKKVDLNVETFGQNIHVLLKNSFFMDSTIGEYAKKKISGLYDKIKDIQSKGKSSEYYTERVSIRNKINEIGEPLIYHKMKSEFEKAYKTDVEINKDVEIEEYKKEIEELKRKIVRLEKQ